MQKLVLILILLSINFDYLYAQSPGGVSTGLRTWYKADAISPLANGTDIASWADQATADGVQNAVQNGVYTLPAFFGNRQPQYRTSVARYNYNPYIDFTKTFSSLYAHNAHSNKPDYQYNYTQGATLYQVGDLTNNQGWFLGSGLGATTAPISGTNFEYGYPWWGLNQQYYGTACGYYYATVDDYGWYKAPYVSFEKSYNYVRPERKTQNGIPWINSISYDKYGTYNFGGPTAADAQTAIQTRMNGDKWSWGYAYTPAGPSLFIGNELTNYNAGRWWQGGIPEVILYDRKLNVTQGNEADKVDTYLALKYGITLQHNYYLSSGTKVWDTACNNSFNTQIAGLVKDAASALNQKQSHSILKKPIVTISLGALNENNNAANASVITDKYTMIWSTNGVGGGSRDSRTIPGGYAALGVTAPCLTSQNVTWSKKKWMVQEQTGKDVGSVKVYIESKDAAAVDWACQAYIVVGTDANFSNPVYYPLSLASGTTNSTTDYVADINFCEGATNTSTVCGTLKSQYFAIVGKGIECAPGGVSRNLAFWVRSDMGTINDSAAAKKTESVSGVTSRVREWVNMTKGVNALSTNATYSPTLRPATRYDNFNPVVSFYHGLGSTNAAGENFDPVSASMTAKNALGADYVSITGADSIALFSLHRNLYDLYGGTVGVGSDGTTPGMYNSFTGLNYAEMAELTGSVILQGGASNVYTAPYAGAAYVTPYNGTLASAQDSKSGRSYSTAGFWFPQNPATVTYLSGNIDRTLRGNGKSLLTLSSTSATPLYNISYRRRDVVLGGNLFGGAGVEDAIVYTGGFKAVDFEVERIETYMGIKGGVTMLHNYYATDKTLLWDTTAIIDALPDTSLTTRYNQSITGIGRDDAECMHQRVSRNVEDTTVTISLGIIPTDEDQTSVDADFTSDKQYLIWGSNGAGMKTRYTSDLPSSLPGCVDSRLKREYHIKLNGTGTGNYKTQVRWQLGSDNNLLDAVSATSISLLIDDDGDGNFNTGTVRVIPATSYDIVTNTAVFDNVTWSTAGDTNLSDAAMTIGWGQTSVSKVVLFNGSATGGGNCSCAGANSLVPVLCTDASNWTYYKNPYGSSNNKVLAINWGSNVVTSTITLEASTAAASRRKTNLNVNIGSYKYDSAATVGARMVNITLTSGSITAPVKVRFYYDSVEIKNDSSWIVGNSTVGTAGGINKPFLSDSSWKWVKYEGTIANMLSNLTASGLPAGDGITANTASVLIPDSRGKEDGVNYVQFDYITNFSTIGYMQTFVKNSDVTVLPLKLLDFTAVLMGSTTNIAWTTTTEQNIIAFEVERSIDGGLTFQKFATSNAKGGSAVNSYDAYDDVSGKTGKIFYRLKVIVKDGSFSYTPIKVVTLPISAVGLAATPNPFTTQLSISYSSIKNETINVKIISINGTQIVAETKNAQKGNNVFPINVSSLSAGQYVIEIVHEDGTIETKKIVKQ